MKIKERLRKIYRMEGVSIETKYFVSVVLGILSGLLAISLLIEKHCQ